MTNYYPSTNDSGTLGNYSANGLKKSTDSTFQLAGRHGVWIIGDSITSADVFDFATRLSQEGGGVTAVISQGGAPARAMIDEIVPMKDRFGQPKILVCAVGTNDIFGPEAFLAQIERVKEEFPDSKIVWVTTYVQRWSAPTATQLADSRNSGRINGMILSSGVDRVVDWGRFLTNKPGRDVAYLSDGVHTTDGVGEAYSGRGARNQLIVDAVRIIQSQL